MYNQYLKIGQKVKMIDQGIGVPASQLEDVFLPMMRVANVGNIPDFGLTIAKKIIDMHQGQLTVDSTTGQGTTVCILLPTLSLS
ncbi:sensor histidine kinase KdpD [Dyadobacter sp. 50-39]|uniref:sensor histidine kinase n=1 Tax=Dyadobacter sp. 50-39 TaxID=1895756 RepID=UPI000ABEA0E2|nr:ATP-binding protein [Dyadobacter sp. 50-39]